MMEKKLGNVKVKSMNGALDDIPNDCGYECRFQYDVDMHSNGIAGECIEWCQTHCRNRQTSMIPCVITGRNRTVT